MSEKLSEVEVIQRLLALPGWTLTGGKLYRSLKFDSFVQAFAFMTAAALEAEKMNHHPDWSNSYTGVDIYLQSHDVQGITERDFRLATRLEALVAIFPAKN